MFFPTTQRVQPRSRPARPRACGAVRFVVSCLLLIVLLSLAACNPFARQRPLPTPDPVVENFRAFEADIEGLRVKYHIPGISLAVVQHGELVTARGLGYANLEQRIIATENTTYRIASLTKPIAATIIMQLVEEGNIDLDAPFATYDPEYATLCSQLQGPNIYAVSNYNCTAQQITVRHHLTHTSQGEPGTTFVYHSGLYGLLARVIENATGTGFEQSIESRIIAPLALTSTATGQRSASPEIAAELAQPYRVNAQGTHYSTSYPVQNVDAAAGIVSNVLDLAAFSTALDQNTLISAESKQAMWTPTRTPSGQTLPYGSGWFVQDISGTRVVWHFGWWPDAFSALLVKVPDQDVTLVLLANSDGLSAPFDLGTGDLRRSPFAEAFFNRFTTVEVGEGL